PVSHPVSGGGDGWDVREYAAGATSSATKPDTTRSPRQRIAMRHPQSTGPRQLVDSSSHPLPRDRIEPAGGGFRRLLRRSCCWSKIKPIRLQTALAFVQRFD